MKYFRSIHAIFKKNSVSLVTHHENHNEDEADAYDDEEGDQVVLQRKTEFWNQDNVASRRKPETTVKSW